jgi:hypothetical protein
MDLNNRYPSGVSFIGLIGKNENLQDYLHTLEFLKFLIFKYPKIISAETVENQE